MIAKTGLSSSTLLNPALASLTLAASLVGCASPPPKRASVAPAIVPAAQVAAAAKPTGMTKFPGYRKVNLNGNTKYCRVETATGSRVSQQTICLSEEELQQQAIGNQRAMETFNRKQVPASDSGSAVTRGPGG